MSWSSARPRAHGAHGRDGCSRRQRIECTSRNEVGRPDTSSGWARQVLNLRPLACEASALPLSYAPAVAEPSTPGPWEWAMLPTSGKRDGGACPRRAAVIAELHSSDAHQVSFRRMETHAYTPWPKGATPPSIDHYRLGSMRREKERRPARGAPAAFRSGGAAFILRVEQLGRGLRATPECRSSLVHTSYSVIGLLTYLCARPRLAAAGPPRGNARPLGSRPFRRGLGGAAGSAARQIRSEA
jgi:hypothetical protein